MIMALKIAICFAFFCLTAAEANTTTATEPATAASPAKETTPATATSPSKETTPATATSPAKAPSPDRIVKAAYWAATESKKKMEPHDINTTLFTHIYYGFVMPDKNSLTFEKLSESTEDQFTVFTSFLRRNHPTSKSLISIGGDDPECPLFSQIAADQSNRKKFVESSIKLAREFGFDGIDLHWEFPKNSSEMKQFGNLLTLFRKSADKDAEVLRQPPLLLSAAVYYVPKLKKGGRRSFPVKTIAKSVDWVNVKCYDYLSSGKKSAATGAPAALFNPKSNVNTYRNLWAWINAGVPKNKLVMGIPLFGRKWTLKEQSQHGLGAPAKAAKPDDFMTFAEVEEFNEKSGVSVEYDSETVSAYSYAKTTWVGYDNENSTIAKVQSAQNLGIRGYFFWALSYDTPDSKLSTAASNIWVDDRLKGNGTDIKH